MRTINADTISNAIASYVAENAYLNDTALSALEKVAQWISEAPTVEAAPVTYCKDCKWRNTTGCPFMNFNAVERDDYDYCSDGEKGEQVEAGQITMLIPSYHGEDCPGNGDHPGIGCQCDECDYYLECFPDWEEMIDTAATRIMNEYKPALEELAKGVGG